MKKKVVVLADVHKKNVVQSLEEVRPWLESTVDVVGWYSKVEELNGNILADYLIVFGGDGLLLSAARQIIHHPIPVLGVNFGKLGFLAEFFMSEFQDELPHILNKEVHVASRMMLYCKVKRDGKIVYSSFALNDNVIKCARAARMLYTQICIDGEEITSCGGDGIIISTPVGSTAYSLSAGGPIVASGLSAIILTPICPHVLTLRPLVISSNSKIDVKLLSPFPDDAVLTIDGQVQFPLEKGDEILISKADKNFYLVEGKKRSYFRILREKLFWGEGRVRFQK